MYTGDFKLIFQPPKISIGHMIQHITFSIYTTYIQKIEYYRDIKFTLELNVDR